MPPCPTTEKSGICPLCFLFRFLSLLFSPFSSLLSFRLFSSLFHEQGSRKYCLPVVLQVRVYTYHTRVFPPLISNEQLCDYFVLGIINRVFNSRFTSFSNAMRRETRFTMQLRCFPFEQQSVPIRTRARLWARSRARRAFISRERKRERENWPDWSSITSLFVVTVARTYVVFNGTTVSPWFFARSRQFDLIYSVYSIVREIPITRYDKINKN